MVKEERQEDSLFFRHLFFRIMNRGKKYQNRIGSFMHTIGADTGSEKNAGGFETVHGAEERDSAKKRKAGEQ